MAKPSQKSSQRYELNLAPYDTHAQILKVIEPEKLVLEVGCGSGHFSECLTNQRCRVVGMELDSEAAKSAESHCERVIVCDLNELPTLPYPLEFFDVLLFLDVLEHLIEPIAVLKHLLPYAKRDGQVILSIPNVANWVARWDLLRGRWNYTETGLLDRSHLRFFTRKSARALVENAGLRILSEDVSQGLYPMPIYRHTVHRLMAVIGWQDWLAYRLARLWPSFWGFQFLIVATVEGEASSDSQGGSGPSGTP